ncbi:MAG: molybdate ABC transporter substrate-binding protein [Pseudomonadota bacterium]
MHILLFCLIFVFALDRPAQAQNLRVAVAANFRDAAREIADRFSFEHETKVALSVGSTGQLAGQILLGAPFDVFLAADRETPAKLIRQGHANGRNSRPYALGRLVLVTSDGTEPLPQRLMDATRIAVPNPRSAPYGRAAKAYLERSDLWAKLEDKLVFGQSASASFAAVRSGAADRGLIALSLAKTHGVDYWPIPTDQYPAIEQHVLQVSDTEEAAAFVQFLLSPASESIIKKYGYGLP